jgi:FAD/FMN-containing dehydrogenase
MANQITNYDGGIVASPQQLVYAETVEQIQAILMDKERFPSPVRAMGSFHSLTPCSSSSGTIINMSRMNRILEINLQERTITAQAGLQLIDASRALRAAKLQFMTNIEIGNITLGSAACCHTKDALDGIEYGQVNSYLTRIKWVDPSGELKEADKLLYLVRSSYGLCGIVYEVTFKLKPLEGIRFTYLPREVDQLTEDEVSKIVAGSEGLICWTLGRTAVFQSRSRTTTVNPLNRWMADVRRFSWNFGVALVGRFLQSYPPTAALRNLLLNGWFGLLGETCLGPEFGSRKSSSPIRPTRKRCGKRK